MKSSIKQSLFFAIAIMTTLSFSSCSYVPNDLERYQLGQTDAKDLIYHGYITGQFLNYDMVEVHMDDVTGYTIWAYFPTNLYKTAVYANRDATKGIRVYVAMRQVWSWCHMSHVFEIISTQVYPWTGGSLIPSTYGHVNPIPTVRTSVPCNSATQSTVAKDDHHVSIQVFGNVYGDVFGPHATKSNDGNSVYCDPQPQRCLPYQSDTTDHSKQTPIPTVVM